MARLTQSCLDNAAGIADVFNPGGSRFTPTASNTIPVGVVYARAAGVDRNPVSPGLNSTWENHI